MDNEDDKRLRYALLLGVLLIEAQIFLLLSAMTQVEQVMKDLRAEKNPAVKLMRDILAPPDNSTNSTARVNLTATPKFPAGVQP